jgi:chromosome transmission fidelity protein 18
MERTKPTKASTFFGGARQAKDAGENDPPREEGERMFVSSYVADEPLRKRNKTTAADVDATEKVSSPSILSFHLSPTLIYKCLQPALDFFGRPVVTPKADVNKPPSSRRQAMATYRVSFKFKEGNSAAVRKPVKMASFL